MNRVRFTSPLGLIPFAVCMLPWIAVSAAAAPSANAAATARSRPHGPPAANIVLLICDGCGYNHFAAADLFLSGSTSAQHFERFPVRLGVTTFSANGAGYSPEAAWADFDYVRSGWTDSAAAATALATGVKTSNGMIGVDPAGLWLKNVVEAAEAAGKATGVVTTVPLSHATPAGFVAHVASRQSYAQIAIAMIEHSDVDVAIGTGHPFFDNDGRPYGESARYDYVGGRETWQALVDGSAGLGTDADHNGLLDDPWTLVESRDEFLALAQGPTPRRLAGVAQAYETLQCYRGGDSAAAAFAVPPTSGLPTLADLTRAALNVLDDNPDGFFLMVEGGAVDWASHRNWDGRMIEEQVDFFDAVDAVEAWARAERKTNETLIVVTADHETGYLTRSDDGQAGIPWAFESPAPTGAGVMPGMAWHSDTHTNSLVPLWARGPRSRRLLDAVSGRDPHRGSYVDNTAIARLLFDAMK